MSQLKVRGRLFLPALAIVALFAAACSGSSASAAGSGSGSGGSSVHIASPKNGASVPTTFTVKIDASAPLGDPSTGDDHVHLCFDGGSCDTEYQLVYGNTFTVNTLSPGTHTIEASLRNADHSAAGPTDSITVHVSAGAAGSSSGTSSDAGSGSSGYGSGSGGYGSSSSGGGYAQGRY